jgi:hypothetical protein
VRTTLDIDGDVLEAARKLAQREKKTIGQVISELVRKALADAPPGAARAATPLHGFRPFPRRGAIVTNELINRLREQSAD